jgi:hypothetical protein
MGSALESGQIDSDIFYFFLIALCLLTADDILWCAFATAE